jgi:xanthine dehydrogenase accessory factor
VRELVPRLQGLVAAGERVVLAVLVSAWRSAPRPVGTVMAIGSQGTIVGSLTGGCVEAELALAAEELLAGGAPQVLRFGIEDERACAVGLPCGGEIEVLLVELAPALLEEIAATIATDARQDLRIELPRGRIELVAAGTDVDEALRIPLGPPPLLVVVGAVDLAEPLCSGARTLGWRSVVVDSRSALATAERLPSADEIRIAWPADELRALDVEASSAIVVLTHQDHLDLPALDVALRGPAGYVGALGSRRTQERRREALRELGVTEQQLERLHGPAGLDIGAARPAEIALAILAEIVAARSGRGGAPLRERSGPIHERTDHSARVTA